MPPIPIGLWKRSRELITLTTSIAGQEFKHQLRARLSGAEAQGTSELRTRIAQALRVAESLGRLKGAFMKAGQLLSIDASEVLPPEVIEILSRLQGQAEAVDFDVIHAVLVEELGEVGFSQFTELERRPIASASIGQVHRGWALGSRVAVKVQYPGIADSIDTDIGLVSGLARSWLSLTKREIDLEPTFEELRTVLHLEADYVRERAYLEQFSNRLANDPRFEVPQAFASLSSARVLTMSWAEGLPLDAWIRSKPTAEERLEFGRALLDLYCSEFFEWGMVQTDPNFGNFLIRPNERRIVLLDFGATLEYPEGFRHSYTALLRCIALGDRQRIASTAIDFGLLDSREPPLTRELFVEMLICSTDPFHKDTQPFAFGDSAYFARSVEIGKRFVKSLKFSAPPRKLLFLHRKLGGIFQLLKRLDVRLDLSPYWERMVAART